MFVKSFILHRKNMISSTHIIFLHCNFYLSFSIHTQIHESIVDIDHDNENDFSRSENEKAHRDDKASKVNDERKTLQKNDKNMNVSIRRTTKRRRFAIEKKFSLKRHIKLHRFSSSFSSNEEDETKFESNTNNYAFVKSYRIFNLASVFVLSLSFDRERKSKFNKNCDSIDKMCRQHSLSRTMIVYEQQC